jgi:long-chain fatty acid transport protein
VDGTFSVSRPVPLPIPPAVGAASDFSTRFHFPDQVSGGWRLPVTSSIGVELGVEWLGWSSNDRQPLNAGANQPLLPTPALENHWQDTVNVGVSVDWALNQQWKVMAGYAHHDTPVPDQFYSPVLPDADRHILSTGLAWADAKNQLSAGVSFSRHEDRTITNNSNPAFNGSYEMESLLWGIAYSRKFQ